jgi:hypothetical protein
VIGGIVYVGRLHEEVRRLMASGVHSRAIFA